MPPIVVKQRPASGGGVRAVDRQPPAALPVRRTRESPKQPSPETTESGESESDSVDVGPRQDKSQAAAIDEDDSGELDESLWQILNNKKVRSKPLKPRSNASLSSADSSSRHRNRKSVGDAFRAKSTKTRAAPIAKLPPRPSQRPHVPPPPPPLRRPVVDDDDDDDDDSSGYDDEDDSSEDEDEFGGIGGGGLGVEIDPLEEETLKAVRKAKLLARVEQLQARNIKPSKTFNYRSSEEELMVEVARMEVLAERSIRVTQGRSALSTTVKTIERIAGFIDRKNYLPIKANIGGFSKELVKDIDQYDDCLERGVAETLGPASSRVWWVECLWILIPSMIWYSMTNRMTEDPKYASEVMRQNPEFQDRLAREMAKEMSHTERVQRANLEEELKRARDENAMLQRAVPPSPMPLSNSNNNLLDPKPPTIRIAGHAAPPPRPIPNDNPLGDLPVDPSETARMQAFLAQQRARQNADGDLKETVRQTLQQGMQDVNNALLGDQRRARQQQETEQKKIAEQQRQQQVALQKKEARKKAPSVRPRLPPPPSQRNTQGTTMELNNEDSLSESE